MTPTDNDVLPANSSATRPPLKKTNVSSDAETVSTAAATAGNEDDDHQDDDDDHHRDDDHDDDDDNDDTGTEGTIINSDLQSRQAPLWVNTTSSLAIADRTR